MAVTAEHDLTLTIQQLDSTDTVIVRRVVSVVDKTPIVGEMRIGVLTDNTETTISLPKAQIRQLYLKNLDTAAQYTVKWTPNGGAKATILVLGPSDAMAFWHTNTGSNYGISLLTITSNTNQTQYFEIFVGG